MANCNVCLKKPLSRLRDQSLSTRISVKIGCCILLKKLHNMGNFILIALVILVFSVFSNDGKSSWNIFHSLSPSNASVSSHSPPSNYKTLANQRLSALRNLRDQLKNSTLISPMQKEEAELERLEIQKKKIRSHNGTKVFGRNETESSKGIPMTREALSGVLFKSLDKIFSLALASPLRKMITSKQGIESLAKMVIPKRDVLQRLIKIKGNLEPTLKRYLTEKYNGFLASIVPYSENIGVPAVVINSMKIPQGLDPRWQVIQSIIKKEDGLEKFIHSLVSGEAFDKLPNVVESRSGDETELISDQEPDATGQQYRKHQQMYLSSFKRRLMRPNAGGYRLTSLAGVVRPALDYENILDQNGQFSQVSYDLRTPEDGLIETSYPPGPNEMDMMLMSASGGRGHGGYGHGHGHTSNYGGFLDPFTILGGLAFLTYLGLMLQNSLNNNNNNNMPNPMPMNNPGMNMNKIKNNDGNGDGGSDGNLYTYGHGRSAKMTHQPLEFSLPFSIKNLKSRFQRRSQRSVDFKGFQDNNANGRGDMDDAIKNITRIWKDLGEIEEKRRKSLPSSRRDAVCRHNICKIIEELVQMNLMGIFKDKLEQISGNDLYQVNNFCKRNFTKRQN